MLYKNTFRHLYLGAFIAMLYACVQSSPEPSDPQTSQLTLNVDPPPPPADPPPADPSLPGGPPPPPEDPPTPPGPPTRSSSLATGKSVPLVDEWHPATPTLPGLVTVYEGWAAFVKALKGAHTRWSENKFFKEEKNAQYLASLGTCVACIDALNDSKGHMDDENKDKNAEAVKQVLALLRTIGANKPLKKKLTYYSVMSLSKEHRIYESNLTVLTEGCEYLGAILGLDVSEITPQLEADSKGDKKQGQDKDKKPIAEDALETPFTRLHDAWTKTEYVGINGLNFVQACKMICEKWGNNSHLSRSADELETFRKLVDTMEEGRKKKNKFDKTLAEIKQLKSSVTYMSKLVNSLPEESDKEGSKKYFSRSLIAQKTVNRIRVKQLDNVLKHLRNILGISEAEIDAIPILAVEGEDDEARKAREEAEKKKKEAAAAEKKKQESKAQENQGLLGQLQELVDSDVWAKEGEKNFPEVYAEICECLKGNSILSQSAKDKLEAFRGFINSMGDEQGRQGIDSDSLKLSVTCMSKLIHGPSSGILGQEESKRGGYKGLDKEKERLYEVLQRLRGILKITDDDVNKVSLELFDQEAVALAALADDSIYTERVSANGIKRGFFPTYKMICERWGRNRHLSEEVKKALNTFQGFVDKLEQLRTKKQGGDAKSIDVEELGKSTTAILRLLNSLVKESDEKELKKYFSENRIAMQTVHPTRVYQLMRVLTRLQRILDIEEPTDNITRFSLTHALKALAKSKVWQYRGMFEKFHFPTTYKSINKHLKESKGVDSNLQSQHKAFGGFVDKIEKLRKTKKLGSTESINAEALKKSVVDMRALVGKPGQDYGKQLSAMNEKERTKAIAALREVLGSLEAILDTLNIEYESSV